LQLAVKLSWQSLNESSRDIIMVGCLHMIDATAALLKFARENNIQIVSPDHQAARDR
jgi:hypothetical protein